MTLGPVGQNLARKLTKAFSPAALEIIDESHQHHGHAGAHPQGESHFRIKIVASSFHGKPRVERHRMVNAVLADELKTRVHALTIEAKSPGEALHFVEFAADDQRLIALLTAVKLPADDLSGKRFFGLVKGDHVAACGGLDIALPFALLRSVAVDEREHGKGLGRVMTLKLVDEARNAGAQEAYLLTADAIGYFERSGFEKIARAEVPEPIRQTSQFAGTACSSAQAMRYRLQ